MRTDIVDNHTRNLTCECDRGISVKNEHMRATN